MRISASNHFCGPQNAAINYNIYVCMSISITRNAIATANSYRWNENDFLQFLQLSAFVLSFSLVLIYNLHLKQFFCLTTGSSSFLICSAIMCRNLNVARQRFDCSWYIPKGLRSFVNQNILHLNYDQAVSENGWSCQLFRFHHFDQRRPAAIVSGTYYHVQSSIVLNCHPGTWSIAQTERSLAELCK